MLKIKKSSKNKTLTVTTLVIAVVLLSVSLITLKINKKSPPQAANTSDKINLSPATEEDKKSVESNKNAIVSKDEQLKAQTGSTASTSLKSVKPVITYAGVYGDNIELGGYVNDVFEDGGKCTAVFKKDDQSLSKVVNSVKNNTAVDCPAMSVPRNEFKSSGIWSLAIEYSSSTAKGVSDSRTLEVK